MKKRSKEYKEGFKAWSDGANITAVPYPHGSDKWQRWLNGWGDKSDKALLEYLNKHLDIH